MDFNQFLQKYDYTSPLFAQIPPQVTKVPSVGLISVLEIISTIAPQLT